MNKKIIAIVVVLAIIVIPIASMVGSYNTLVSMDEDVNGKWAQVENVLKRRADLIPNLVSTVQGFADQEKEVLLGVTEARSKVQSAGSPSEYAEANGELTSALSRLNVVVESYPELKSNENFIRLQDELAGTENRISVERGRYNESVQQYNSKIRRFPTRIVAGIFGFEQKEYFEVSESDMENPEVNFN
jgi:LemA protein